MGQPIEFSNRFVNTVTGVIADVPTNSHLRFSALRSLPANYTNGSGKTSRLYTYLLLTEGSDYKTLEAKLPGFYAKYIKKELGELTYRMELQPLTAIHLNSHLDYEANPNGDRETVGVSCPHRHADSVDCRCQLREPLHGPVGHPDPRSGGTQGHWLPAQSAHWSVYDRISADGGAGGRSGRGTGKQPVALVQ